MKKTLTVSVIIPAYNEADYIARCLDALLGQSIKPDEIIVVDNNSSDNTVDIVRTYADRGVTLINEPLQGLYYSRATGMDAAAGDVLCRIDADTEVLPGWMDSVVRIMANPTTQFATGPCGYYDFILKNSSVHVEDYVCRSALKLGYHFAFGANMVMRRSFWKKISLDVCDSKDIMEDIDCVIHAKRHGVVPVYDPHLAVRVSSRRVADGPTDFIRYITGHTRTMRLHGQPLLGARYSVAMFMLFYIIFKPWHRMYDNKQDRFRLMRLFEPTEPRPDPMRLNATEVDIK